MLDETLSVVSLWTSVISWLTPAVLFFVVNLVIGTIAFTSSKSPSSTNNPHAPQPLPRSPSVLHRLRSLHLYRSEIHPPPSDSVSYHSASDPEPVIPLSRENADSEAVGSGESVTTTPSEEEDDEIGDVEGLEGLEGPTMEQVFSQIQKGGGVYGRSKSVGGQVMAPKKVRRRLIQKAASDVPGQFSPAPAVAEEDDEEEGEEKASGGEVDGQAADFISRFRKQLKLQREESLFRANA